MFLAITAGMAAAQTTSDVIGQGWGLDHVIMGLSNPDAVKNVFGANLGFSPLPGNKFPADGLEQAIIDLPPAYIEFLWPYEKPANETSANDSLTQSLRQKIESGGGLFAYNLDVSPAEQAADIMRHLGLKVSFPPSRVRRTPDGKETPGASQYIAIDPQDQAKYPRGVPGGPLVGFLEYRANGDRLKPARLQSFRERVEREVPDARRAAGELHANTARKLLSVWVTVPNVAEAVRQCERFGFAPGRERYVEALGEKGREVQCGQGTIMFFQARNQTSALSTQVKKGGLGLIGVAIAVADLRTAQRIIEEATNKKFPIMHTGNRMGFVVPAAMAAGTYIELDQQ